jgi:hypothetical protein
MWDERVALVGILLSALIIIAVCWVIYLVPE